jgi:hypothetical protein
MAEPEQMPDDPDAATLVSDDDPLATGGDPASPPSTESAPPSRIAERLQELTGELGGLRSVTAAQQAELQRLRAQAGTPAFTPKPEYESHEFKQYLDRQYGAVLAQQQQIIAQQNIQLDLVNTRMNIDDQYGTGTYRKLAKAVEDEFQAEWAKGTPESREKIFYRIAAQRQMKLVPVDEREDASVRQERRRSSKLAVVSQSAPARAATAPGPEKPMSAMTKEERDAAFQGWIQKHGGF